MPFAVGTASVAEVAEVLERLWGGAETLLVISTDLSHYHAYARGARASTRATLARIAALRHATSTTRKPAAPRRSTACLPCARKRDLPVQAARGMQLGRHRRRQGQRGRLFVLRAVRGQRRDAREAGQDAARHRARGHRGEAARQARPRGSTRRGSSSAGATFVTLLKDGRAARLHRQPEATRPLGEDVARERARRRVSRPALPGAERRGMAAVRGRGVAAFDAQADALRRRSRSAAQIRAGEDGLILEADGTPRHVPAAGLGGVPDKRAFLGAARCARPACRPTRASRRCRVSRYRVIEVDGVEGYPGRWWHSARRRPHPVRPVPARLQAARGPARPVLRAQARRRRDGAHHLRPLVGLLRRPDREEAAQPLLSRASSMLSFGTAGCNLACKFCQNWDISKSREMDRLQDEATPEAIAARGAASWAASASRSPTTTR